MKVLILADLPLWTIEGLEKYKGEGAYSSWLEALFPFFGKDEEMQCTWFVFSKHVSSLQVKKVGLQSVYIFPRWKKSFSMLSRYHFEIRKISPSIRLINPDVVHCWGAEDVYGIAGARLNYPKVFTLQGSLSDYLKKMGGKFLFRVQASMEKYVLNSYQSATAESELAKDLVLELNPRVDVSVIDYGVHPSFYEVAWTPSEICHFVFVGRIDERKGIDLLVHVFSGAEFQQCKLTVIGDGPLKESLQSKSSSNISWLGRQERTVIQGELAKSWCLVMPTFADTGPTVLKEARVVGLPVIITHNAGAADYICNGKNGAVIDSGDTEQLKEAMLRVARNRESCIAMGSYNHESTRKSLHPSKTVDSFKKLYRSIIR